MAVNPKPNEDKPKLRKIFVKNEYNALYTALLLAVQQELNCSQDEAENKVYEYLDRTPKTTLVTDLMKGLDALGYTISKKTGR